MNVGKKCLGCGNMHDTEEEFVQCYVSTTGSTAPKPSPADLPKKRSPFAVRPRSGVAAKPAVAAANKSKPPTGPQLYRIDKEAKRVGELVPWPTTRQEASERISTLIQKQTGSGTDGRLAGLDRYNGTETPNALSAPVKPQVPVGPVPEPQPTGNPDGVPQKGELTHTPVYVEPLDHKMVARIPSGSFAVHSDDYVRICFIRVKRAGTGAGAGTTTTVQSRMFNKWQNKQVYWSGGRVSTPGDGYVHDTAIPDLLIAILSDLGEALIRYSDLTGECCDCNHGLVGPDEWWYGLCEGCQEKRPDLMEQVVKVKGIWYADSNNNKEH